MRTLLAMIPVKPLLQIQIRLTAFKINIQNSIMNTYLAIAHMNLPFLHVLAKIHLKFSSLDSDGFSVGFSYLYVPSLFHQQFSKKEVGTGSIR